VPIAATPPRPRTTATPAPPAGTDFTVLGGSVRVVCVDGKASVLSVQPNAGYVVKDLREGPADEVRVVFRSTGHESEIKVRCQDTQPMPRTKESTPR
jgi:hypothetical protein